MKRLGLTMLLFAGLTAGSWSVSKVAAAPPWWEGSAADVPAAAAQTGKPVVLYFTSPSAAECVRMDEETWRPMNPVWADLQFIWLKLEPKKDAEFFKYWEINQVPQVVVLDSQMKDKLRLRGFIQLEEIKDSLTRVSRETPSMLSTVSGRVVPASNPGLGALGTQRDPFQGHAFYEDFNAYKLLGSLRNPPFNPIMQASCKIETSRGIDNSSCLAVDAGSSSPSAFIQIDISQNFPQMDQVIGRIRLRTSLKSVTSLGRVPVEVMALAVIRTDTASDDDEQTYVASLSDKDKDSWRDIEIVSAPLNFRINKAFVLLKAPSSGVKFLVDNICVDLLPVDDVIPFVDADAQVLSLAQLAPEAEDEPAEGDDFFSRLAARTKEKAPASVSNNVTQAPKGNAEKKVYTDEEVQHLAEYLATLPPAKRVEYFRASNIPEYVMRRVSIIIMKMKVDQPPAGSK